MNDSSAQRRAMAVSGHRGDAVTARLGLVDPRPAVRATALAAVARAGGLTSVELAAALEDPAAEVRRRACEVAAYSFLPSAHELLTRLGDIDATVVEVAAWALGEVGEHGPLPAGTVGALSLVATTHCDALAREAAVASLGALGDPGGLAAILTAMADKPAVRRRAVLALAPFEGPDVAAALERATHDRDWQVRDAASLLLGCSSERGP